MQKPSRILRRLLLFMAIGMPAARGADTILHTFTGGDGSYPYGSLTLIGSTLYGMTSDGGGSGTLFSMNTDGSGFALLHNFLVGADGNSPWGSLTPSGTTLYGMTSTGGSSGNGTVFSINTNGTGYSILRNFTGAAGDGGNPSGTLTLSGSTLYGMSTTGGSSGKGAIFSMNTNGSGFSLLYSFTGGSDGSTPRGMLTLSGSTLYGLTYYGGGGGGDGTLFGINTNGTGFQVLHSFGSSGNDGTNPFGSLTLSGTTLYGMAQSSGSGGNGTIFRVNTDGTGYSVLHSFTSATNDGSYPHGSLTLIGSKLYGMTQFGGTGGWGTIFSVNTDGTGFQVLQSFLSTPTDGSHPYGDLTLSADGSTFYGMTREGGIGNGNEGTVFSAPVPEPATFGLLSLGALLLAASRRRMT